jgi:hypothetical protein
MHRMLRVIALFAVCHIFYTDLTLTARADETQEHDKKVSPLSFELPHPPRNAIQAATKGKQGFEKLIVNDKHARELGFDSKADAADSKIQLGSPFALILVNIEMLKTYAASIPPKTLISFTKRFIFPVRNTISGETKSSVTVLELTVPDRAQQEWKPVEWGKPGLVRPLDQVRQSSGFPNASFALWIPALSRYFLGVIKDGQFMIIPLYDEPNYGFLTGIPKPAAEVFTKISKEAREIPIPKRGFKKR